MTKERIAEVEARVAAGETVRQIAESWKKSPQMIYRYVPKKRLKHIRRRMARSNR